MAIRMSVTDARPVVDGGGNIALSVAVVEGSTGEQVPGLGLTSVMVRATDVASALAKPTAAAKKDALAALIVAANPNLDKTRIQATIAQNTQAMDQATALVRFLPKLDNLPLADAPAQVP